MVGDDKNGTGVSVIPLRNLRKTKDLLVGADAVNLQPIVPPEEGGHVVSARYPENLLHALDRLFTKRAEGFNYETRGQFLRDCLFLGLEAIDQKLGISDHDVRNTIRSYRREQRTHFFERERRKAKNGIHQLREQLTETLLCGDLNETYRIAAEHWEDSASMELDFWRNWYVSAFVESKMLRAVVEILLAHGYRMPGDLLREVGAWKAKAGATRT